MVQQNHEKELNELYNKLSIATKEEIIEQAKKGNKEAKYFLYNCYRYGFEKLNIEQDLEQANNWMDKYYLLTMGVEEAIVTCFKKYFIFKGRASRVEFWLFSLFYFILSLIMAVIRVFDSGIVTNTISAVVGILLLIPYISVTVRRLNDVGVFGLLFGILYIVLFIMSIMSIFNLLPAFTYWVLLIYYVIILFLCAIKSSNKDNRYGEIPA